MQTCNAKCKMYWRGVREQKSFRGLHYYSSISSIDLPLSGRFPSFSSCRPSTASATSKPTFHTRPPNPVPSVPLLYPPTHAAAEALEYGKKSPTRPCVQLNRPSFRETQGAYDDFLAGLQRSMTIPGTQPSGEQKSSNCHTSPS